MKRVSDPSPPTKVSISPNPGFIVFSKSTPIRASSPLSPEIKSFPKPPNTKSLP
jgi:hypothetical protein